MLLIFIDLLMTAMRWFSKDFNKQLKRFMGAVWKDVGVICWRNRDNDHYLMDFFIKTSIKPTRYV